MLGLGKSGEGLIRRNAHCRMTTITDHRIQRGRAISSLSGCLVREKRQSKAQIGSLLAVATVFIGLLTLFTSQGGGRA